MYFPKVHVAAQPPAPVAPVLPSSRARFRRSPQRRAMQTEPTSPRRPASRFSLRRSSAPWPAALSRPSGGVLMSRLCQHAGAIGGRREGPGLVSLSSGPAYSTPVDPQRTRREERTGPEQRTRLDAESPAGPPGEEDTREPQPIRFVPSKLCFTKKCLWLFRNRKGMGMKVRPLPGRRFSPSAGLASAGLARLGQG